MELDSLLTIVAAVALVLLQIFSAAKKRKKNLEVAMHSVERRDEADYWEVIERGNPESIMKPNEGGFTLYRPDEMIEEAKRIASLPETDSMLQTDEKVPDNEDRSNEEGASQMEDFTAQKAILYSQVINPKWNSSF